MPSSRPGSAGPGGSSVRPAETAPLIRHARPEDGAGLHALVRAIGTLELNSPYAYALCADHFRNTTVVAEEAGALVGLVVAYRPPVRPHSLFVWQVGVCETARGQGLGSRMLDELLERHSAAGIRSVEATVTPSNAASRRLFASLARRHGLECTISPLFTEDLFCPEGTHEAEDLFHVGPRAGP